MFQAAESSKDTTIDVDAAIENTIKATSSSANRIKWAHMLDDLRLDRLNDSIRVVSAWLMLDCVEECDRSSTHLPSNWNLALSISDARSPRFVSWIRPNRKKVHAFKQSVTTATCFTPTPSLRFHHALLPREPYPSSLRCRKSSYPDGQLHQPAWHLSMVSHRALLGLIPATSETCSGW